MAMTDPQPAKIIAFTKVDLPYGWLDNMAPYPVAHEDLTYRTTEAPFHALHFVATGDAPIVEDCSRHPRGSGLFWGAALIDGAWQGENTLGQLWMTLRSETLAA